MTIKKSCSIVWFFLMIVTTSYAFQNEPADFRGVKWGTPISQLKGYRYVSTYLMDSRVKYYKKNRDDMKALGVTAEKIEYGFARGRFYSYKIDIRGEETIKIVKDYLIKKYNDPTSNEASEARDMKSGKTIKSENFYWKGKTAFINFRWDYTNQEATVSVYSEEIYANELS